MAEQEEQRGKLASVGSDNTRQRQGIRERVLEATQQQPGSRRRSPAHFVVDRWARFWATSFWEKGVIVGGTALAGIVAIVAFMMLSGGGGDKSQAAQEPGPEVVQVAPVRSATVPPTPRSTATPWPTASYLVAKPTPESTATEPPPAARRSSPNRRDCEEIAGTPYRSSDEREWFLDNCLGTDAPDGPSLPPPQPPPPGNPPALPPTPVPAPTSGTQVSSSGAIALAVPWMTSQSGNIYSISASSCNASRMGARWVVICQADLVGCQGDVCSTTLSACVFEQPLHVAPADSC